MVCLGVVSRVTFAEVVYVKKASGVRPRAWRLIQPDGTAGLAWPNPQRLGFSTVRRLWQNISRRIRTRRLHARCRPVRSLLRLAKNRDRERYQLSDTLDRPRLLQFRPRQGRSGRP